MARRKSSPASADQNAITLDIPLPDSGIGSLKFWQNELSDSEKRIAEEVPEWRINLKRYAGERDRNVKLGPGFSVQVNTDYSNTEQKKAQLFYRTPEIQAKAKRDAWRNAAPLVQAIMNDFTGQEMMDMASVMDELLFDLLCPAGIAGVKVGYDRVTVTVQIPTQRTEPVLDPVTGQPAVDPVTGGPSTRLALGPDGQPETTPKDRTIWEDYYCRRISPADLRLPSGFTSTRYQQAPWKGFVFATDADTMKKFGVDDKNLSDYARKNSLLNERDKKYLPDTPHGTEVFYQACVYDPTVTNPDKYRRLVFVDGPKDRVCVVHEDCKYQEFDDAGAFVKGVKGNPISITSLRTVGDTAYPKSDCQMSRNVVDERSKSRSQMIRAKDSARRVLGYDKLTVRKETITQIENGEANDMVGFSGNPTGQMHEIASSSTPPSDYTLDSIQSQEADKTWALGSNAQGVREDTTRSATEIKTIQNAVDSRLAKERNKVLGFYISLCYQILGLIQMFADDERVVEMIGPDGLAALQTWTKQHVEGEFAFALKPNSAIRLDAAEEAERQLRFNNLTANSQFFDQLENARQLATAWDKDPNKLVKQPPPPQPKTDPPKTSISIKGEDLDPAAPQYPNVIAILQHEYQLQFAAAAPAAPTPITAQRGVPPVDQHDANLTGKDSGPRVQ